MRLIIEEVIDGDVRLISELDEHVCKVGRDLTTDLPLSSSALSRQHGVFLPSLTGWLYKDLGSTNGSWHNGNKLEPNRLVGLKEGDYLQLADVILKIRYKGETTVDIGTRLIIVKSGEPYGEHGFSRMGYRLAIGGRSSSLQINGYSEEEPAVAFEMNNVKVFVTPMSTAVSVRLNTELIHAHTRIVKGDYLVAGEYEFLLIEGSLARAAIQPKPVSVPPARTVDLTDVGGRTTEDVPGTGGPQVFSATHTIAIQPDRHKVYSFGDSSRVTEEESVPAVTNTQFRTFGAHQEPKSFFDFESMSEIERRLVYGIIFFIGASFLLFITWLLFL